MNHAGVHWPANSGGEHPDRETIYRLPGVAHGALLMCADSARFWYGEARSRCPLVVWRGLPRPGRLPANLGWDARRVADEVLNLWSEQQAAHTDIEWFVPLNELQFSKESGEAWRGYSYMTARLALLRVELRSRLPATVRLLFPAWVPSDDGTYFDQWRGEAAMWDGLVLHAYGDADTMRSRYQSYRDAFPGKPIVVGEWNANHTGADERAALQMWADVATSDPLFLAATYYIWETNNAGEHDLSIWGAPDRLVLFNDPPRSLEAPPAPAPPEPIPAPTPPEETPVPTVDPWQFWTAEQIAAASGCALADVQAYWPKIVAQLDLCGIADRPVQIAAIGTTAVESSMRPIHEYGTPADWAGYSGGAAYAGRGFIQLTHDYNYKAYSDAVNTLWQAGGAIDLVARPDDALDPDVASAVLALYFRDHKTVQGYSIPDAARAGDWEWVRRLVQGGTAGLDRLVAIATALGAQPAPVVTPPALIYAADTPPERQVQDWACSIRTATWMLKSLGVQIDAGQLQDEMVPTYVTPQAGLLHGDGTGLADVIRHHLPPETPVEVLWAPSWDDLVARVGRGPIGIGAGLPLYHWLNVSNQIDADTMHAPNPAPHYPADDPFGDTLTRAHFEQYAPWALVFVDGIPAVAPVPVDPPAPAPQPVLTMADVRARLEALQTEIAALLSQLPAA